MLDQQRIETTKNDLRTVEFDLPCLRCGYNLRTLRVGGVCPECGLGVRSTLLLVPDWSARQGLVRLRRLAMVTGWLPLVALAMSLPCVALFGGGAIGVGLLLAFVAFGIMGRRLTDFLGHYAGSGRCRHALFAFLWSAATLGSMWSPIAFVGGTSGWDAVPALLLLFTLLPAGAVALCFAIVELVERVCRRFDWHEEISTTKAFFVAGWTMLIATGLGVAVSHVHPAGYDSVGFGLFLLGGMCLLASAILFSVTLLLFARRLRPYVLIDGAGDDRRRAEPGDSDGRFAEADA